MSKSELFLPPATRHRCKFFCGGLSMNFIVFIEWLGRKLIVFCVSVCLPHTPIQIWRLHLEKKVVLHLETILRGDAERSERYIWPKIFRRIGVMAGASPT